MSLHRTTKCYAWFHLLNAELHVHEYLLRVRSIWDDLQRDIVRYYTAKFMEWLLGSDFNEIVLSYDLFICLNNSDSGGHHMMPGSLTPPDKLNGEPMLPMTSNPLDLGSIPSSIQTPPSPIPTPSPPLNRTHTDINGFQHRRYRKSQLLICVYYMIFNGCEVRNENSITRVFVLHHEACKAMPNSYLEWQNFQFAQNKLRINCLACILHLNLNMCYFTS